MKRSDVAPPAQAVRVLLVDDNHNGLLARKSILQEQGFEVTALSSPEDAIALLQSSSFQLLITDYRMPQMSGLDVIRRVRELLPSMPIVLISGMVDALGLNEKNTGADAVVAKSANEIAHLVHAVQRLTAATPKKPAGSQGVKRGKRSAK